MPVGLIYDDIYLKHAIGHDVETPERLIVAIKFLKEKGIWNSEDFPVIKPRKATLDQINYVHSDELIAQIKEISELAAKTDTLKNIDADTIVSGDTYESSLYSVGGNLTGIDKILQEKINSCFALVRPPGHHSNKYKCAGFCIFNNIAIATEYLFREKNIKKVAIFDWDCHHGNGTQDIFYDGSNNGEILFFSSHQDGRTLYPGTGFINEIGSGKGEGHIINLPMAPYSDDDIIQLLFKEIAAPIMNEFKPEFILISAGFDTHYTDYTNMGWTIQGPANVLKLIKPIAEEYASGRILITLEGGYEKNKQSRAIYNVLKVLNNESVLITENERKSDKKILEYTTEKLIKQIKINLSEYWNCF